jgi:hypothetical protein
MSSSDDLFLDSSLSPKNSPDSLMDMSPSPSLEPIPGSTPGSPSPAQPAPTQASLSPPSPTPPSALNSEFNWSQDDETDTVVDCGKLCNEAIVQKIKVEFYDANGEKVCQSRFCKDSDIIDIVRSLSRANEPKFRGQTVSKFCKSDKFKHLIEDMVLKTLSDKFARFIASDGCPLKNFNLLSEFEDLTKIDFENIFEQCLDEQKELISAICSLCFGVSIENLGDKKHLKQRLVAVIAISSFSRNQKTNNVQKILGEYFKLSNTGKQGLQLLQRLGLTLVPMSIRENEDAIGTHFLSEVKERKKHIETWHERRLDLESMIKEKQVFKNKFSRINELTVEFPEDKFVEEVLELGDYLSIRKKVAHKEPDPNITPSDKPIGNLRFS